MDPELEARKQKAHWVSAGIGPRTSPAEWSYQQSHGEGHLTVALRHETGLGGYAHLQAAQA